LSTHQKDRIEKLEQLIAKLTEESAKGKPIVVEGKKDAQALQELGVAGRVLMVKSGGKSFLQATSEIEASGAREVILLLDFDRRGREGTKLLQRDLERAKIKADIRFWLELRGLVGHDVQCIEGLPSYLVTLQLKVA
jgi:2,5-diamino-6-(ribosylamino)-4(3H)-pyrimidinone 5'-phosphate reductase